MAVALKQPEIRFNMQGPMSLDGVSFAPKVIFVEKIITTAIENNDFIAMPAGTFITEALAVVTDACDANTEVTLGTDGTPDALITTTAFSVETVGNSAKFSTGLYLPSGDTLRIAVGGTPVAGAVRFVISYFELVAMAERGKHFNL